MKNRIILGCLLAVLSFGSVVSGAEENELKLLAAIEYEASGEVDNTIEYSYDENGNQISFTKNYIEYNEITQCRMEYDENNNLIKWAFYRTNEESDGYHTQEYDAENKLIKYVCYDENNEVDESIEYEYDENGYLVKEVHYKGNGSVKYYIIFENDGNGNVIKATSYENDEPSSYREYEYDEAGNRTKDAYSYGEDSILSAGYYLYSYDENGFLVKEENYEEGNLEYYDIYENDENGNVIKEISYYGDGECTGYTEYVYGEPKIATTTKAEESYDFKTFCWGDTEEMVKEVEGEPALKREMDGINAYYIAYAATVAGKDATLAYYFCDTGLYAIKYILEEEHTTNDLYLSDYEDVKKAITSKYGIPTVDEEYWTDFDMKSYYELKKGDALVYGYLSYWTEYDLDNTNILMNMSADNYHVSTIIQYASKTITAGEADYSDDL